MSIQLEYKKISIVSEEAKSSFHINTLVKSEMEKETHWERYKH